jgi:hypothetical protein
MTDLQESQKLRVLIAQIPMPQNRFLVDLNNGISKDCAIHHSSDDFWNMRGEFEIVHLHFPEHLTYEIEKYYFDGIKNGPEFGLTDELIAETEKRLRYWSAKAKLVVTRHVLLPHDALRDIMWEKMYELFYSYADGVAHFAQASIDEFRERYKDTRFVAGRPPIHVIIPHQNYTTLPNEISRSEARKRLGIPEKASVLLVFGAIRNGDSEKNLIVETFGNLRVPNKLLLVSSWRETLAKVSWIRLKYWLRDLNRLYYKLHPSYNFNYGFVEEKDAQTYLNAADVLFIPRLRVLNSGNITLGMTFGRVVVGPDSWDVGELLRETGNPVFDPDHPETAAAAVEEGFRLAAEGKIGPANQALALREWGADQCARRYVDLFEKVVSCE